MFQIFNNRHYRFILRMFASDTKCTTVSPIVIDQCRRIQNPSIKYQNDICDYYIESL